jgi:hypothetical protein
MAKELENTVQSARYQVKNGSQEERTRRNELGQALFRMMAMK